MSGLQQLAALIGQRKPLVSISILSSWASKDLALIPRIGGQYYLYSPVSGSGCTARFRTHTHTLKHTPGHVCVCACALALLLHSCQWAAEGALHMVTDGSATWSTGELLLLDYLCGGAALCITTGSSFFTLIMGSINVLLPRDDFVAGSFSIFILILITISFLFKGMFLQVTVEESREWLWERVGIDPGQFIFCCPWWVARGEIASLSPVIVASELKRSKKERGGRRKPLV